MIAALMNLQQNQQEQFQKHDDIAERNVLRLEAADERKLRQNSALVALTDVQRSLMHLMLMREVDIAGQRFYLSQLQFSPKMKKMVETKSTSIMLNQLRQLMEGYACCPNTTLWFKFFRSNGFLPPGNLEFGGCSVFMMIPGY